MAFILAATGAAVGLGNVWKFPYMAGANGGGAFVLVYLACVLAIGLPIMMAEVLLGRRGRRNPINTMKLLSEEESGRPWWQIVGWSGVIAGFIILSYYSVIAGWAMDYVFRTASGLFVQVDADTALREFNNLVSDPVTLILWHTLFMAITVWVVARGVQQGLESAVRFMMPALFTLLLVMVAYAMTTGEFLHGIHYMFAPDFRAVEKNTGTVVLMAMGQAFFTLSLGMGGMMAYGAYLPDNASIAKTSLTVVFADTAVAILAGLAIFPIVFANHLDATEGPGLIFQTLPLAFGRMPGGVFFGTLFFVLLVFAAWTSSISLIEPAVARMVEHHGMTRHKAAWTVGIVVWLLGLGTVFSFNVLAGFKPLGLTIFGMFDFVTSDVLLPLGGLLIAVFAGWVMCKSSTVEELEVEPGLGYGLWRFLVRFVAPLGVLLVLLNATGLLHLFSKA
jgi:NSS family neurotransmitter:Na+ symporter